MFKEIMEKHPAFLKLKKRLDRTKCEDLQKDDSLLIKFAEEDLGFAEANELSASFFREFGLCMKEPRLRQLFKLMSHEFVCPQNYLFNGNSENKIELCECETSHSKSTQTMKNEHLPKIETDSDTENGNETFEREYLDFKSMKGNKTMFHVLRHIQTVAEISSGHHRVALIECLEAIIKFQEQDNLNLESSDIEIQRSIGTQTPRRSYYKPLRLMGISKKKRVMKVIKFEKLFHGYDLIDDENSRRNIPMRVVDSSYNRIDPRLIRHF